MGAGIRINPYEIPDPDHETGRYRAVGPFKDEGFGTGVGDVLYGNNYQKSRSALETTEKQTT